MQSINPFNNRLIQDYPEMSSEQVIAYLEAAQTAYKGWGRLAMNERAVKMHAVGEALLQQKDQLAQLMTQEMGKPLREAAAEVEKCAWVCRYYADEAASFLGDKIVPIEEFKKAKISFRPQGIVFAIMPWNYPLWQVFRFAAPTLMAGNVGVLKHAENVTGCGLAIEKLFRDAGFPEGVFTTLVINREAAADVICHPFVKAVTLTGSTAAGKSVASTAGAVLKKTVLELGGSDPYVVLRDADLDVAVENCVQSRFLNNGQSCISAKRFIVHRDHVDAFTKAFVEQAKALTCGDPSQDGTRLGPMARLDLRDHLHEQVQRSIAQGARCVLGGQIPEGPGAFYPPTVLTGVTEQMTSFQEEMFGPVASIIAAEDDDDAIRLANASAFGLGGAVFSKDLQKAEQIATENIETGTCVVNSFVKSDPRLPFGGIGESGYGRELSLFGIHEFVNIKTVVIA